MGGLKCIVISHPHFYTTHVEWAQAFQCPVYTSEEDAAWLNRRDTSGIDRRLIRGNGETIFEGVTAIKAGGHFDGSLILHWDNNLFIADTMMTTQVPHYFNFERFTPTDLDSSQHTTTKTDYRVHLRIRSFGQFLTTYRFPGKDPEDLGSTKALGFHKHIWSNERLERSRSKFEGTCFRKCQDTNQGRGIPSSSLIG